MNKMGYNNHQNGQFRSDPNTKMLYGIMKELQRANALNALKMRKAGINPAEVDEIMDTDPSRTYRNEPEDGYSDGE
jgi:hypothetical protein